MRLTRRAGLRVGLTAMLGLTVALACQDSDPVAPGQGHISLRLTDAPFPLDEVESIDVFVLRIDARMAASTEADAEADLDTEDMGGGGWVTIASPNASFNLMTLLNGVSVPLGGADVAAGTYRSLRLVLDTDLSGVTLKVGDVLTGTSTPSILFPSAGQSGIKVMLDQPIILNDGEEIEVLVDFDAGESFVLRGNTILQNGLLFKPVIHASLIQE
jgi:hypothetical protein